jgi:hypothetical protein
MADEQQAERLYMQVQQQRLEHSSTSIITYLLLSSSVSIQLKSCGDERAVTALARLTGSLDQFISCNIIAETSNSCSSDAAVQWCRGRLFQVCERYPHSSLV